jgi:hypothetical protein
MNTSHPDPAGLPARSAVSVHLAGSVLAYAPLDSQEGAWTGRMPTLIGNLKTCACR